MTKEQIKQLIEDYKTQNENDLQLSDMFQELKDLAYYIEENTKEEFLISFDNVMTDSDSYTFCTCYSDVISKSIIIDWSCRTHFETEEEVLELLYNYNEQAKELLAKIK